MPSSQTTAAVWTPWGRGAVASIRICGDLPALAQRLGQRLRLANDQPWTAIPSQQICFGHWGDELAEDVVTCRIDERTIEVHCHGGAAAPQRILADLAAADCAVCDWQTQFESSSTLLDTEHVETLSLTTTWRAAAWVAGQAGRLDTESQFVEAEIARGDWAMAQSRVKAILEWSEFGRHLTEPWSIVIGGRPNVGKSSLINAQAGFERSIVFDQPGTTRDVVSVTTAWDGWPVKISDTAGLRSSHAELESAGIERARQALSQADLRVVVIDISQPPHNDDRALLAEWPDALIVANKCDLPDVWLDDLPTASLLVSALRGDGMIAFAQAIAQRLVPRLPPNHAIIPLTARQTAVLTKLRHAIVAQDHRVSLEAITELRG